METPPWLSADQQEAWLKLAAITILLPAALDTQLQQNSGLTHFDYLVLAMLSDAPERTLRMSDLAARSNSSLSRLSHVVSKLERADWVRREPSPEDGRATNAIMTDAGWEKIVASAPDHVRTVRSLVFDALTEEEIAALARIGGKLIERLDPNLKFTAGRNLC